MRPAWGKVRDLQELQSLLSDPKTKEDRKPPPWLEIRHGSYKASYRVSYRRDGLKLQTVLKGDFTSWQDARKAGDELIGKEKYSEKTKSGPLLLCSVLADEIIDAKRGLDPDTYDSAVTHFSIHIIPYLNEHCRYVGDLDETTWKNYYTKKWNDFEKRERELSRLDPKRKRKNRPKMFNHWKHFSQLLKWGWEKGIIGRKMKIENPDQMRDAGREYQKHEVEALLRNADDDLLLAILMGYEMAMRRGEILGLSWDRVAFKEDGTGSIHLRRQDTKNRKVRTFKITKIVLGLLKKRKLRSESPYVFPSPKSNDQPCKRLDTAWENCCYKAGIKETLEKETPHFHWLRHTALTRMARLVKSGRSTSAYVSNYAGITIREFERTYLHLDESDTAPVADAIDQDSIGLLEGLGGATVIPLAKRL